MSTPVVHGGVVKVTLESVQAIGIAQVRFIADALAQMLAERHGVVPGPLHHECQPAQWLETEDEMVYMPAMVMYWREGTKDG